ncbi:MAG TPA: acetate--CoA ligase [Acidiferrobacteraceae bacterium]|nr:acetate--CoA ligase [Acidiferrobacteraceae bacterium]
MSREQPSDEPIQSVLQELRVLPPPPAFSAHARIGSEAAYQALCQEAERDYTGFWARHAAQELTWHQPFTEILDDTQAPHFRWFADGLLNVSVNCLDRHLEARGDQTAILFEGEPGDIRRLSWRELHAEVCRLANALRQLGVQMGDRVVLYMPMVPEAVIAMQACARIGAIHSVVFGGFSVESLKDRIDDAAARVLITADGGHRGGKIIPLKAVCDEALTRGGASIEAVLVLRRAGNDVVMKPGRDLWWHDLVPQQAAQCDPVWVSSEHPLYLLYTSGSTGKPKGIQHSSAGYLLGTILTMRWVFDIQSTDIFWCTADVGWVTGHSYVAYGPLACGVTIVMYEGAPQIPDYDRFWSICARHRVSVFYTAPTAIRALMKQGDAYPARHDLSALRLLGTVGEPINPEAWMWYHRVIGGGRCPIVDTWWQTETGVHMIAPLPGATPLKPGSCTRPLPGIAADVVNEQGASIREPDQGGYLVITKPWPSMLRTIWGDPERYRETYWRKFGGRYYLSGDGARRDADGYFWIMGRVDDVLKVSGHRLGTMEIEATLAAHPRVAEAAVVGRPDALRGEAIVAFVVARGPRPAGAEAAALAQELRAWVAAQIGAIARPEELRFGDNLPKTRSGKIMRRLLRAIARGQTIAEDVSTLENPDIVRQLQEAQ